LGGCNGRWVTDYGTRTASPFGVPLVVHRPVKLLCTRPFTDETAFNLKLVNSATHHMLTVDKSAIIKVTGPSQEPPHHLWPQTMHMNIQVFWNSSDVWTRPLRPRRIRAGNVAEGPAFTDVRFRRRSTSP